VFQQLGLVYVLLFNKRISTHLPFNEKCSSNVNPNVSARAAWFKKRGEGLGGEEGGGRIILLKYTFQVHIKSSHFIGLLKYCPCLCSHSLLCYCPYTKDMPE